MPSLSTVPTRAGIGLRPAHYETFLHDLPPVPWIEVIPENHRSGVRRQLLHTLLKTYPLSIHSIGLSLGGVDPLSKEHLHFLREFCNEFQPAMVSDHVAWTGHGDVFLNDLLPLPYTEKSLTLIVEHIQETQEFLKRQILVENPSTYLTFETSTMEEADFMVEMAKRSGCLILLDVNNIYVSSHNHGWTALDYIRKMPQGFVGEIHLAGHQKVQAPNNKTLLIDHHGDFIADAVWELYSKTVETLGPKPTLIEWDTNMPTLEVLQKEAAKADSYLCRTIC